MSHRQQSGNNKSPSGGGSFYNNYSAPTRSKRGMEETASIYGQSASSPNNNKSNKFPSDHSYSYDLNGELICSPADSIGCSGFITERDQLKVLNTEG